MPRPYFWSLYLTANSRCISNRKIHHPGAIDHYFNNRRHQRDCRRFCKFFAFDNNNIVLTVTYDLFVALGSFKTEKFVCRLTSLSRLVMVFGGRKCAHTKS